MNDCLNDKGLLKKGMSPIAIGQGYQGKTGKLGVGRCTGCFEKSLAGCPPKGTEIVTFCKNTLPYEVKEELYLMLYIHRVVNEFNRGNTG